MMMKSLVVLSFTALSFAHKQISDLVEETTTPEQVLETAEETIEVKKDFNWFIMTYQMESIAILLLLGAVAFMFIGKSRNY
jgi:hypothetical protein